jgi:hypothetical protein
MKYFYDERAFDATDSIAGTKEYAKRLNAVISISDKLFSTFTEDQKRLYEEQEDKYGILTDLVHGGIYKAGFLDGIALGIIGATHREEVSETRRAAFHLGYKDGEAARQKPI